MLALLWSRSQGTALLSTICRKAKAGQFLKCCQQKLIAMLHKAYAALSKPTSHTKGPHAQQVVRNTFTSSCPLTVVCFAWRSAALLSSRDVSSGLLVASVAALAAHALAAFLCPSLLS